MLGIGEERRGGEVERERATLFITKTGHSAYQFATFIDRHRILDNNSLALRRRYCLQEMQESVTKIY